MTLMIDASKLKRAVLAVEQSWQALLQADKHWQSLQAKQFDSPADINDVLAAQKQAQVVLDAKARHSFASATVVASLRKAIDTAEVRSKNLKARVFSSK